MTAKPQHIRIAAQCHDHSARLAGVPFRRFYTDSDLFTQVQFLVTEYYGFDAPNDSWDMYNIEAEALGQKMIYTDYAMPDIDRRQPLIREPADLDRLRIPDPHRSGRMPYIHRINRLYMERTGRPARVYFCAPFSLALNIRGYVPFVKDMKTDPAFAHRLLGFLCEQVLAPYIRAMREEIGRPDQAAFGADAWASPPNVSLDLFDEFVLPYTQRLRELVGGAVVTLGQWGESKSHDPERYMTQKLQTCPIFLSVLDPDLNLLGPERVKAFARKHDVTVTAGVDAALIMDGPADAVVERIRNYIDGMGRDGRLILYLNQIPVDTPPEHVHAAVAACRTLGRLPIPDHLDTIPVRVTQRESFAEFLREKGETLDA